MMYNFPFFPHFYPRPYYNYPQKNTAIVNNFSSERSKNAYNNLHKNDIYKNSQHRSGYPSKHFNEHNALYKDRKTSHNLEPKNDLNNKTENKFSDNNDILFELFGIKLHYDDILLICLIFFLYNEGVKDEFLFIALVLLLLS